MIDGLDGCFLSRVFSPLYLGLYFSFFSRLMPIIDIMIMEREMGHDRNEIVREASIKMKMANVV